MKSWHASRLVQCPHEHVLYVKRWRNCIISSYEDDLILTRNSSWMIKEFKQVVWQRSLTWWTRDFYLAFFKQLEEGSLLGMSTMQMKFTMKKFKPLSMLVDCRGKLSMFGKRNMKDPKVYKIQMGCLKYLCNIMDYCISFIF